MIPIKIGKNKYRIKTIDELSTAEFIELSKIKDPDVLKYISWQTKMSMDDVFYAVISPTVEKAIGKIPDVTKLKVPKWIDKSIVVETVGQRHQIESSSETGFELLVLCLAVAQARSNNFEEVEKLKAEYMQMPFAEILPAGFFFFKIYRTGKRNVLSYFSLQQVLTRIRNSRKRQVLTD